MLVAYSSAHLAVVDDFHGNFLQLLAETAGLELGVHHGHDGGLYEGVGVPASGRFSGVQESLEEFYKRDIELLGCGLRVNHSGQMPNQHVHFDESWGTWALVLYLSTPPHPDGTAFWRHKLSGHKWAKEPIDHYGPCWDDMEAWEQVGFIHAAPNRAAIYRSNMFHSRWPLAAYGDDEASGRKVVVAFFN